MLQILDQLFRALIALRRILARGPGNNVAQRRIDLMIVDCRRHHDILKVRHDDVDRVFPVIGEPSGDHLVHGDTETVEIGSGVRLAGLRLFRRDIMCRSDDVLVHGIAACRLGDAEIRHLDLAVLGNNDVLRLDVAVDDPTLEF